MSSPAFDHPRLAEVVEAPTEAQVHALPFGAIHLDVAGQVVLFNQTEARLSGYGARPALGRDFFTEVAPCFAQAGFRTRIERARASGELDVEFGHVGDFDDLDREMQVRIQSAADGGLWLFLRRF